MPAKTSLAELRRLAKRKGDFVDRHVRVYKDATPMNGCVNWWGEAGGDLALWIQVGAETEEQTSQMLLDALSALPDKPTKGKR